jgi:hypothetical protein
MTNASAKNLASVATNQANQAGDRAAASGDPALEEALRDARRRGEVVGGHAFAGRWSEAIEEARRGPVDNGRFGHLRGTPLGWALGAGAEGMELARELARQGARAGATCPADSGGLGASGSAGLMGQRAPFALSMAIASEHAPSVALALELGGFEGYEKSRALGSGEPWAVALAEATGSRWLGDEALALMWGALPLNWRDTDRWTHSENASCALGLLIGYSLQSSPPGREAECLDFWEGLGLPSMSDLTPNEAAHCAVSVVKAGGGEAGLLALRERWGAKNFAPKFGRQHHGSVSRLAIECGSQGLGYWAAAAHEAPELAPSAAAKLWNRWVETVEESPHLHEGDTEEERMEMGRFACALHDRAAKSHSDKPGTPESGPLREAWLLARSQIEAQALREALAAGEGGQDGETAPGAQGALPSRGTVRI